jgi:hypothetical protein|tara:strand:- start:1149 stop:1373 length:225 start_codon:yes stop_codon:yes gene_type:complete
MSLPAIIRLKAEEGLSVLDGVILFTAASCLFRFSQDVQERYLFPDNENKSLWASFVIGAGLLMLRGKDLKSIVQ